MEVYPLQPIWIDGCEAGARVRAVQVYFLEQDNFSLSVSNGEVLGWHMLDQYGDLHWFDAEIEEGPMSNSPLQTPTPGD